MAYDGLMEDVRKCARLEWPGRRPALALSEEFDVRIGQQQAGYIFSSGEMIPGDTPQENMGAMMKTAKRLALKDD